MRVEVIVVQKPGENPVSSLLLGTGNWALWADRIAKGATPILTVSDLVSLVVQTSAAKNATVDFIQINGHGNSKGFRIGNDWIDIKSLLTFESELSKIAPHLSGNATVDISACDAGGAKELMRQLSRILGGVAIIGYTEDQSGGLAPVGPPVVVQPGGSYTSPAPAAGATPPSPPPPGK